MVQYARQKAKKDRKNENLFTNHRGKSMSDKIMTGD